MMLVFCNISAISLRLPASLPVLSLQTGPSPDRCLCSMKSSHQENHLCPKCFLDSLVSIWFLFLCGWRRYWRDQRCQSVRQLCMRITHFNPTYYSHNPSKLHLILHFSHLYFNTARNALKPFFDARQMGIELFKKVWIPPKYTWLFPLPAGPHLCDLG